MTELLFVESRLTKFCLKVIVKLAYKTNRVETETTSPKLQAQSGEAL